MPGQNVYAVRESLISCLINPHEPYKKYRYLERFALESLGERLSVEAVSGVYRLLKPFLLNLPMWQWVKMVLCFARTILILLILSEYLAEMITIFSAFTVMETTKL